MKLTSPVPSHLLYRGLSLRIFYQGQTRTCFRCGAEGHVAASCDAPRAEAPSVFLEGDFPPLETRGASSSLSRPGEVPGVVPAAGSASAPSVPAWSGHSTSASPVCSVGTGAPTTGVPRSVVAEVLPRPEVSVRSSAAAVGVVPASPAEDCLLPEDAGVVGCVSSSLPSDSASTPSSSTKVALSSGSSAAIASASVVDAPCELECALPLSGPAPSAPVSGRGGKLWPHAVEVAAVCARAASALGSPASGSAGAPLAGGRCTDDQQPHVKRRRSAQGTSPRRLWAEGGVAMEVAGEDIEEVSSVVPPVTAAAPPDGGTSGWVAHRGDRDLVVVLSKSTCRGSSALVPVGGGSADPAEGSSVGLGTATGGVQCDRPEVQAEVRPVCRDGLGVS
ncbi:uncharacterized protein [Procambarus clarkii]|uniref:uncharacterized protein n=1 Tax=Procambarus clarkii TaxID=6728 RepID=UPI0037445FB0